MSIDGTEVGSIYVSIGLNAADFNQTLTSTISKGIDEAAKQTAKLDDAVMQLEADLKLQIATFGKVGAELQIAKLAYQGLTQEELKAAQASSDVLKSMKAQSQAVSSIEQMTRALRDQADTWEMNTRQAAVFLATRQAASAGAPFKAVQDLHAASERVGELESRKLVEEGLAQFDMQRAQRSKRLYELQMEIDQKSYQEALATGASLQGELYEQESRRIQNEVMSAEKQRKMWEATATQRLSSTYGFTQKLVYLDQNMRDDRAQKEAIAAQEDIRRLEMLSEEYDRIRVERTSKEERDRAAKRQWDDAEYQFEVQRLERVARIAEDFAKQRMQIEGRLEDAILEKKILNGEVARKKTLEELDAVAFHKAMLSENKSQEADALRMAGLTDPDDIKAEQKRQAKNASARKRRRDAKAEALNADQEEQAMTEAAANKRIKNLEIAEAKEQAARDRLAQNREQLNKQRMAKANVDYETFETQKKNKSDAVVSLAIQKREAQEKAQLEADQIKYLFPFLERKKKHLADINQLEREAVFAINLVKTAEDHQADAIVKLNLMYVHTNITVKQYLANMDLIDKKQGLAAANMRGIAGDANRAAFAFQQLAFMIQDASSVYALTGFSGAVRAGSNNLIQAGSLLSPKWGTGLALAAVPIGLIADHFAKVEEKAKAAAIEVQRFDVIMKGLKSNNDFGLKQMHNALELDDLDKKDPQGIKRFIQHKHRDRAQLEQEIKNDKAMIEKSREQLNTLGQMYALPERRSAGMKLRDAASWATGGYIHKSIGVPENELTPQNPGRPGSRVFVHGNDTDEARKKITDEFNKLTDDIQRKKRELADLNKTTKQTEDARPEAYLNALRDEREQLKLMIKEDLLSADAKKIAQMERDKEPPAFIATAKAIAAYNESLKEEIKLRDILKGYREDMTRLQDEADSVGKANHQHEIRIQRLIAEGKISKAAGEAALKEARAMDTNKKALQGLIAARKTVVKYEDRKTELQAELELLKQHKDMNEGITAQAQRQMEIAKMKKEGAPADVLKGAEDKNTELTAIEHDIKLQKDAIEIRKKHEDPIARMKKRQEELNEMLGKGIITQREYNRSIAESRGEFNKLTGAVDVSSIHSGDFWANLQEQMRNKKIDRDGGLPNPGGAPKYADAVPDPDAPPKTRREMIADAAALRREEKQARKNAANILHGSDGEWDLGPKTKKGEKKDRELLKGYDPKDALKHGLYEDDYEPMGPAEQKIYDKESADLEAGKINRRVMWIRKKKKSGGQFNVKDDIPMSDEEALGNMGNNWADAGGGNGGLQGITKEERMTGTKKDNGPSESGSKQISLGAFQKSLEVHLNRMENLLSQIAMNTKKPTTPKKQIDLKPVGLN